MDESPQSFTAVHQVTEEELPQYMEHVISNFKHRSYAVCMHASVVMYSLITP